MNIIEDGSLGEVVSFWDDIQAILKSDKVEPIAKFYALLACGKIPIDCNKNRSRVVENLLQHKLIFNYLYNSLKPELHKDHNERGKYFFENHGTVYELTLLGNNYLNLMHEIIIVWGETFSPTREDDDNL